MTKPKRKRINVISLGCSKNLVDAERIMKQLSDLGFDVSFEKRPHKPGFDTVIINTCGFIGDAKQQSVDEILLWCQAKEAGFVKRLYVMGCLSERYRNDLPAEIPEVDGWYGKFDWGGIAKELVNEYPAAVTYERTLTTPRHYSYLKISEGCNRFCAFCAIPIITGRHTSRPIDELLAEASAMVKRGVREINVIAQDLSAYGTDLYGRSALAELVDRLADIEGLEWIRLHYAYPADFPIDVLDVMAKRNNVCKYIDIALQHGSDKVLSAMHRHITVEETTSLLATIREKVPGIHIRTTMMTGFPGEDEEAFSEMMDFVRKQKFERMGAFAYCEEEGTFAACNYTDSIPEDLKKERLDALMELQEKISLEHQQSKVGSKMRVIIDGEEDDYYVARSEFDSPDVDPSVLVKKSRKLVKGEFYTVEIIEALPYDLIAVVAQ